MASKLYIKRLEMSGFKSFVRRTTFNLDPGLTAIVGPNGCGKSNIIDAVRWVLGEQSARVLRGQKMEELIFHGSEKEKPVGMAEISITFDNEANSLPKQGPEFSITRRLYRSGESEYLINRSPVRLKDITDLILDTGVTTGAYVIMEQGKIDSILTARPTERMALFEEAAGVMRYQLQKEEAQRKLEATQTNLVRVGDIVHELKRQLDSLEKQARHAEQYQEMRKRARELRARQRAGEMVRERDEMARAEESAGAARQGMETVRITVTERQAVLKDAREKQATSETAVRELEREQASLRERLNAHRMKLEDARLRDQMLSVQEREREGRQKETEEALGRLAGKAVLVQQEEEKDSDSLTKARVELADFEGSVRGLEAKLGESRESLAARRKELGTQADSLHRAQESPDRATAGPLAEFRERAPSVEWPLGEVFRTEDRYSGAIKAGLGPLLDAAVVDTWEHARALLGAWREKREAPLTLVVLESIGEPAPRGELPPGAAGWADELVSCSPKFAGLARALLGNVAIVEGEMVQPATGAVLAFTSGVKVTPPGIVWWPGRIPGGRTATGTELAMLLAAAVRELGEIESRIVEIEADLSEARRWESAARVESARLEQRLYGRRGERETIEQTLHEAEDAVRKVREELDEIRSGRKTAQDEAGRQDAELADERRVLDESSGRLVAAQDELHRVRDLITVAETDLDSAREKLETLQAEQVGLESRFHETRTQYELVKHEFETEFGTETGRLDELAAQPLNEEESGQLGRLEGRIAEMGEGVNLMALDEFTSLNERYAEYQKQIEDLRLSREKLQRAIYRLDRESERRFDLTFATIRENFHAMFRRLFGGGDADLKLTESEEGERGIEIEARPPGKRQQSIALLSGGERALVSTSLLFSLYMTKPSPFCFLDELDAPLDDANTDRFMKILKEFGGQTQFVLITHNKHSMELVDSLYGITMEDPGVSKIISVRLKTVSQAVQAQN
jgi:chromosome segregation protein